MKGNAVELSTLTSKGQTTIPADIRRQLNLHAGDKLHFMVEDDHILIVPAKRSIKELKGILPKPERAFTIEEMDEAVQEAVAKNVMDSMS